MKLSDQMEKDRQTSKPAVQGKAGPPDTSDSDDAWARLDLSAGEITRRFHARAMMERRDAGDFVRIGLKDKVWGDLYHHAVTARWSVFALSVILTYLTINVVFALLYAAGPAHFTGLGSNRLLSLFFFSVQTLSTVGYGGMMPSGVYANSIVSLEVFFGMMLTALVTGVVFARFARPRAQLEFSRNVLVTTEGAVSSLCVRVVNMRLNVILAMDVEVALSRLVVSEDGHLVRRFDQLGLVQSHVPELRFGFILEHIIKPDSLLHDVALSELERKDAELIVTVTGVDKALGQTVFASETYRFDQVRRNCRFVDMMSSRPDGRITVDYSRLHDVENVAS
ncbi:ion channel [Acetobacter vaccinii]|mgnify:FL=1|nr:ion channel [Acetobacter vaccinii]